MPTTSEKKGIEPNTWYKLDPDQSMFMTVARQRRQFLQCPNKFCAYHNSDSLGIQNPIEKRVLKGSAVMYVCPACQSQICVLPLT